MTAVRLIASAAALTIVAPIAHAQGDAAPAAQQQKLEDVVVYGMRMPGTLLDTQASVGVLTSESIIEKDIQHRLGYRCGHRRIGGVDGRVCRRAGGSASMTAIWRLWGSADRDRRMPVRACMQHI